jgi:hypothetical protein
LAPRTSRWPKEVHTRGAKGLAQLVPHLVAADSNAGAERGQEVLRPRPTCHEGLDRTRRDPDGGPAPARVRGRDKPLFRVHEEDGKAVGGLDAQ